MDSVQTSCNGPAATPGPFSPPPSPSSLLSPPFIEVYPCWHTPSSPASRLSPYQSPRFPPSLPTPFSPFPLLSHKWKTQSRAGHAWTYVTIPQEHPSAAHTITLWGSLPLRGSVVHILKVSLRFHMRRWTPTPWASKGKAHATKLGATSLRHLFTKRCKCKPRKLLRDHTFE
jgi:hypothetical protein